VIVPQICCWSSLVYWCLLWKGRLCTWTEWSALCVAGFVTGSSSGSLWDNGISHNNLQWQDGYSHNKQGKTITDCCSMSSSRVAAADYHLKYIPFLHCPYQPLDKKAVIFESIHWFLFTVCRLFALLCSYLIFK
jgi:hypothetical protein